MTLPLEEFIAVIGKMERAHEVQALFKKLPDQPLISSTPEEYNDPVSATTYYQFFETGVECGFRSGIFSFAHFLIQGNEEYKSYQGKLAGFDTASLDHNAVKAHWGRPQQHGGGYLDSLIGFVRPWMRYEMPDHLVRFEFSDDMRVYAVTLMPEQNSSL
ncbi:hypothetical protein ACIPLR_23680 [Herbaspirillum huttiense]|jgi:hypothetical protein|uniref:hypothetical protein n=1 Tax=Herbaspirillum huttiense TaxID=863372 RepID=UPI000585B23E|nr:hypothetical protein [Herbaspirillum huttiense]MBN9357102.1 hypothetical protein [Herbaspirillum huttiense]